MDEDKRKIHNYEVKTAIHIGGKEIILAEDLTSTEPYMVCDCSWDNPLSMDVYANAVAGTDYLEAMSVFLGRVSSEVERIQKERSERSITGEPLTTSDCVPGSASTHYEGQLVVIRPENMVASARSADMQLLLATGGNGCNPDARGQAVFCKNLFTGKTTRWDRKDVAGIIRPERIPAWAHRKLQEMEIAPPVPETASHPLYMNSLESALKNGEAEAFHNSWKLNEHCAAGIEKAINDSNQESFHYDLSTALKQMTSEYGKERVHFVLANTMQILKGDGRLSEKNQTWAQGIQMPDLTISERASFFCKAHPVLLDGLANTIRRDELEKTKKPSVTEQLKAQPKSPKPTKSKKKDTSREEGR